MSFANLFLLIPFTFTACGVKPRSYAEKTRKNWLATVRMGHGASELISYAKILYLHRQFAFIWLEKEEPSGRSCARLAKSL